MAKVDKIRKLENEGALKSSAPVAKPTRGEARTPSQQDSELRMSHYVTRVLALQRLSGNQAVGQLLHRLTVQRKFRGQDGNATLDKASDLGLIAGQSPSKIVVDLLLRPKTYFLRNDATTNFESPTIRAIDGDKKYLLGEDHGDGTWGTRTSPWQHVPKMREGIKGFKGQDVNERTAVSTANVVPTGQGLPLEDMHAYALTKMIMTQQLLGGFDDLMLIADGEDLVKGHLDEVYAVLRQYATIGSEWFSMLRNVVPPPGSWEHDFMSVGLIRVHSDPSWTLLSNVQSGKKPVRALDARDRKQISVMLAENSKFLINLIDTRPMGRSGFSLFKSKQGTDPIANRTPLEALGQGPGKEWAKGMKAALAEGNSLREAAMANNIKAAAAPLLVQVGDAHVDSLKAKLGTEGIAVKIVDSFDTVTTEGP